VAVEKKNETLGIRMGETMLSALKGIAEADGLTVSELVLNEVSRLIEERRAYWSRLDSIFRDTQLSSNAIRVDQCDTNFGRDGKPVVNSK
jgi:predicted DNA-binding ribbon-helix-helix protein